MAAAWSCWSTSFDNDDDDDDEKDDDGDEKNGQKFHVRILFLIFSKINISPPNHDTQTQTYPKNSTNTLNMVLILGVIGSRIDFRFHVVIKCYNYYHHHHRHDYFHNHCPKPNWPFRVLLQGVL